MRPATRDACSMAECPAEARLSMTSSAACKDRMAGVQMGRKEGGTVTAAEPSAKINPPQTLPGEAATVQRRLLLKRAFDIVFSAVVLLLSLPLSAPIAIGIHLSSPGPVLFVQKRVGLNGKLFPMLKFRTMRVAGKEVSDRVWSACGDPRCTPLGAFLRKTSLDELPQFLNVLRGEMSVVGPRPERPHFVRQFRKTCADYRERHRLKVGITGWAQVNGLRGDTSIPRRMEYDLYYLKHWSFGFDLKIIGKTLISGFFHRNAC